MIDILTGNATQNLRHWLGVEWIVDQSSWDYTACQAAGIGVSIAAGFFTGGAGWALLGVEAAGGLFSYIYVGINNPGGEYGENPWLSPWNMLNALPATVTGLDIAARFGPQGLSAVRNTFGHSDDMAIALSRADDVGRRLGPSGGKGLFGFIKPSQNYDPALRTAYEEIVGSPAFARDLAKYNRLAKKYGQTESATPEQILDVLRSDTAFARTSNPRAGLFVGSEHSAAQRFLIQGNPLSTYGPRAARHELVHLGASIRGQADVFAHEILVQRATTPEVLYGAATGIGTIGIGVGAGIGYGVWWGINQVWGD